MIKVSTSLLVIDPKNLYDILLIFNDFLSTTRKFHNCHQCHYHFHFGDFDFSCSFVDANKLYQDM
jgi:hypothetical protein